MDIRRFLVGGKSNDGGARAEKNSGKVERKKPSSKRRRIALLSDSDDEDFLSTKKKGKAQEGTGVKRKMKDESAVKGGRPAKIASLLSKKDSAQTSQKRTVMSAEDFFSSPAKLTKSTTVAKPTKSTTVAKPTTPAKSRIEMKLETFKRQNRNKELEKAKPQTEGDKKPSKSPKKAPESQRKRPVVATVIKPAVETKEVEEKEERITAVTPSPKRSLSDSSEVKDRGSPVKPEVKKSVSVGEISRKSYRDFMQRQGPTQLGTKQLPEAGENCLEGQSLVVTGVLESFERDDIIDYIKRYGGKILQQVGKRTSYCIVGRDAGPAKLEKIKQFNIKSLNEDEFLSLMQSLPSKQSKYFSTPSKKPKPPAAEKKSSTKKLPEKVPSQPKTVSATKSATDLVPDTPIPSSLLNTECEMWADKYRPKSTKEIIGQQGEKSNVKKLGRWLENWHHHNRLKTGGRKDDGSMFKAALLSGPPGVGKTTSASLVCCEKGFTYIELNASDTRNKRTLQETVKDALGICDIASIVKGDHSGKNQALIMDEVDGMSGNEDRGGIQELISLIKSTHIPVICICNNRNHPKIRSLANYCFDLRFQRPRIEQIKGAMMKIAFKEKVDVKAPAVEQIAVAANGDIRQTLHHLYMWSATGKALTYDEAKDHSNSAKKQLNLTPFEAVRKVFAPDTQRLSLIDQSELFFQDYSIMPLFVQENYLSVTPINARDNPQKALQMISKAADSLTWFDVTDRTLRTSGDWGLLPLQAVLSCSIPAFHLHGSLSHMVSFPQWLGRNSKQGRLSRVLHELSLHTYTKSFASPMAVNQDYVPALRQRLTHPLIHEGLDGVSNVVSLMKSYCLTRDDWESILELGQFPGRPDLSPKIDSKVKSAFTRAYNKSVILSPFITSSSARKTSSQKMSLSEDTEAIEGVVDVSSEEEEDVSSDAMIKAKKPGKKQGSGNGAGGGKGKGQGRGRGKGRGKASS